MTDLPETDSSTTSMPATPPPPRPTPPAKEPEMKKSGLFHRDSSKDIERIIIRTYPKIVFLYPTMIMAFVCAIFMSADTGNPHAWGSAFLIVFAFNLCVLAFDFPRTASLTLVFSVLAIILAAILLNQRTEFFPFLSDQTGKLKPDMNATFYWLFGLTLALILLIVGIIHRFVDYWEVLSNELIHHHGILGGIQRLPAPGIKLEKEITDVFEYLLLQSGTLVITPQGESRAIVLETVPNINKVEDHVKAILGVTEVSMRQTNRSTSNT
jgi:hypothetical protein